jgi:hypothetical protein
MDLVYSIDIAKFADWINKNWKGPKVCPICQNNKWNIAEKAVELREFLAGSINIGGGTIYPLVTMTCEVCGHTLLFNAVVAKVLVSPVVSDIPPVPPKQPKGESS